MVHFGYDRALTNHAEEDIEVKIPAYRQVIGLRNIIAHGYDIVENNIWNVLVNELPTLKKEVQEYL